ncbi:hypothetical protein CC78DRAFT_553921 [Lojkania enalia]|uniref:Uncharacterized protein n=1 Tax=Lojkania enalia TaxID=147567 RepID=A0A9P4KC04_9PLEO|nr:hypothetical protein CC78DRAFT_553921 [Didymosphaeria enalia]
MIYNKIGLEAFNESIIALITNRCDKYAKVQGTQSRTFERVDLSSLNHAFQGVGSIMIPLLVKHFRIKAIITIFMLVFAIFSWLLLAGTGGTFVLSKYKKHPKNNIGSYGHYNTDGKIPIYCSCGIGCDTLELVWYIIPRNMMGSDIKKLPPITWYFIHETGFKKARPIDTTYRPLCIKSVVNGTCLFIESVIVGGPNFGELLGAFSVLLFPNLAQTPIPWLRLDSLMLLTIWYLPYWYPSQGDVKYAWIVGATSVPVFFDWADGDVFLAAYFQRISTTGAVMAYAITLPIRGRHIDNVSNRNRQDIHVGILERSGQPLNDEELDIDKK